MRKPTLKSKISASMALVCVFSIFLMYGWVYPKIPEIIVDMLVAAAVGFVFLARFIRESEGVDVIEPANHQGQISKYRNIEIGGALASMLSVFAGFASIWEHASINIQRVAFILSAIVVLLALVANVVVDRKYKKLLRMA